MPINIKTPEPIKHVYPDCYLESRVEVICDCGYPEGTTNENGITAIEHCFTDYFEGEVIEGSILVDILDSPFWMHKLRCRKCGKAYDVLITKERVSAYPVGFSCDEKKPEHPLLKAMEDLAL